MEPFLKQLKLAYVFVDLCPIAAQKWKDDDFMCRTHVLSSLSDHLFDVYCKKAGTAKELWDELKLVYLIDEHGSKRVPASCIWPALRLEECSKKYGLPQNGM